jgi:SnoaL-like polyketide cyclase
VWPRPNVPDGQLTINDGPPSVGRAAVTETARSAYVVLPDMQVNMNDLVVGDERIEYHWTFTGTDTGPAGSAERGSGHRLRGVDDQRRD